MLQKTLYRILRYTPTAQAALIVGSLGYAIAFMGVVLIGVETLPEKFTARDYMGLFLQHPYLLVALALGVAGTATFFARVLSGEEPDRQEQ